MKISKYLHSCLVFELDDYQLLVDPGKFSFAEGLVKAEDFAGVQSIIITHNHPDHLDAAALKNIISLSGADVYTNAQVKDELSQEGITAKLITPGELRIGPFNLFSFPVKHQPLLDSPTPEMTAFVINDEILHPVDSFEDSMFKYEGIKLLLLPIMAPFCTELEVAAFADKIKPEKILPVHDGYARDFFVKQRYENYAKHFEKSGIEFLKVNKPGEYIEL